MPSLSQGKSLKISLPFSPSFTPYSFLPCLTLLPEYCSSFSAAKAEQKQTVTHTHRSPKEETSQACLGLRVQDISFQSKQSQAKNESTKATSFALPSVLLHRKGRKVKLFFFFCRPRTSEGQCSRGSYSLPQHCHIALKGTNIPATLAPTFSTPHARPFSSKWDHQELSLSHFQHHTSQKKEKKNADFNLIIAQVHSHIQTINEGNFPQAQHAWAMCHFSLSAEWHKKQALNSIPKQPPLPFSSESIKQAPQQVSSQQRIKQRNVQHESQGKIKTSKQLHKISHSRLKVAILGGLNWRCAECFG